MNDGYIAEKPTMLAEEIYNYDLIRFTVAFKILEHVSGPLKLILNYYCIMYVSQ